MPFEDPHEEEYEPELGPDPPEEPDPESDLRDWETDLSPAPEPPDPGSDLPEGLAFTFWYLVIVFNVSILAVTLGALFLLVAGRPETGRTFLFVGTVLGIYGLYRYWTSPYRDGVPDDEAAGDGDGPTAGEDPDDAGGTPGDDPGTPSEDPDDPARSGEQTTGTDGTTLTPDDGGDGGTTTYDDEVPGDGSRKA